MFRNDGDLRFRNDRDQFFVIPGTVITMKLECFPQGEVALDITPGKLFLLCTLRERPSANEENVHAKDQGSPAPPL